MKKRYRIVRFYYDARCHRRILTHSARLEEAKAHCNNPESSSSTCRKAINRARTQRVGRWFDGYEERKEQ